MNRFPEFVTIPAGSFTMGEDCGADADTAPAHEVRISTPFRMAVTPVTNAQYEQFDPAHRAWRGDRGLSLEDDEAVLQVSWHEACTYCRWLTEREGVRYRLPTEAEWEYACRAGTPGPFHTGDELPQACHRHQHDDWNPHPVSLEVGRTPPNPFGLRDLHGLVEEWCQDWYGPYLRTAQVDPVGRARGAFRVTRGGSHNADLSCLRTVHRAAAMPEDRSWHIGFRLVQAEPPTTLPLDPVPPARVLRGVAQAPRIWIAPMDTEPSPGTEAPLFAEPIPFVRPPEPRAATPFHPHNHCPAVTWCANGDLLAAWFSTVSEAGREMTILASRLRAGHRQWDPASEFFKVPDRNMTGTALLHDGAGRLYHTNGVEASGHWANLALVVRTSEDNGATWSTPRFAQARHQPRNQVIAGLCQTPQGWLMQPCDAVYGGQGGTALHISRDRGETWEDPGAGTPPPEYVAGGRGGTIAGIHAGVVMCHDGSLLALGRGDSMADADGEATARMPASRSADMGRTWRYSASPWPPISGGQRLVLLRLREGPLLFVSFTDASDRPREQGLLFPTASGHQRGYGAFAALSFDEGDTWPLRRLLTDGRRQQLEGGAWTGTFRLDHNHAEPKGYLAATQTPDGVIHLLSSRLHYRFNLAWMRQVLPG